MGVIATGCVDYHPWDDATVGAAFGYTNADASLGHGLGDIGLNTYSLGVFGTLTYPGLFLDASAAYHLNQYDLSRPGVVPGDSVNGDTDGDGANAALAAGYILHYGNFRFGPKNKVASLQPVEALGIGADRKASQLVTNWEVSGRAHRGVVQPPAQDQEQPHEREVHQPHCAAA